jgi:hypothetical protein
MITVQLLFNGKKARVIQGSRKTGFDASRPHVYVTRCIRCGDETTVWVAFMLATDMHRKHRCARCLRQAPRTFS